MPLKFFGRGSGFTDGHTSAYFTEGDEMIIIDCPVSTFQKIRHFDLPRYKNIYVLITHTHGDHIGGLGLLVQYLYFELDRKPIILAPHEILYDIEEYLRIEGCSKGWFYLKIESEASNKKWYKYPILTTHSPQLKGKCFGYKLVVDGKTIIYTGDTLTLDNFIPHFKDVEILYVDTSMKGGGIHLKLEDALEDFVKLTEQGVQVYLMHLDDVEAAEKIVAQYPNINVVSVE